MALTVLNPMLEDISQIPGPYLREYFRGHHRLRDGLGFDTYFTRNRILIRVMAMGKPYELWRELLPSVEFKVVLDGITPSNVLSNLCIDLIEFAPPEYVLGLRTKISSNRMKDLLTTTSNIKVLDLFDVVLSKGFLQPNPDRTPTLNSSPHSNICIWKIFSWPTTIGVT